jgi:hypothetical protein
MYFFRSHSIAKEGQILGAETEISESKITGRKGEVASCPEWDRFAAISHLNIILQW